MDDEVATSCRSSCAHCARTFPTSAAANIARGLYELFLSAIVNGSTQFGESDSWEYRCVLCAIMSLPSSFWQSLHVPWLEAHRMRI